MIPTSKLTEELATTIEWIRTSAQAGADAAGPFIAEQTPLYIEELIRWTIVQAVVALAIFIVFWFVAFGIATLAFVAMKRSPDINARESRYIPIFVACGLFLFVFPMWVSGGAQRSKVYDAFKAYYAPRVFVVDKLTELLP